MLVINDKRTKTSAYKILVVENDQSLIDILEEVFEEEGYRYTIFNDVLDILPLVDEYQPDLVLLDFVLPRINGGELCSQLKSVSGTQDIPVIIYSAAPKAFLSLGDYGCDLFIPKPFDLDELVQKINSLLPTV
ncbi:PleD family two-component system response regulator [Pedobacter sp. MC2016-24]|uniref:response regulator n=1 Tax=Pedobacter sp. MC2016-24 TaxID=2780090 RepID=UPI001882B4CF|nr:response regulator [Pedobacter sp. MC2016-24]MBE9600756.1 response regulator [Pedobacter sp. MC2016-24]